MFRQTKRIARRERKAYARLQANTYAVEHTLRHVYEPRPAAPIAQVPRPTEVQAWFRDVNGMVTQFSGRLDPREREVSFNAPLPPHIKSLDRIVFEFDNYGQVR